MGLEERRGEEKEGPKKGKQRCSGASYTCSRSEDFSSGLRLDRFLVSTSWEKFAPNVIQTHIPRLVSDHSPILLDYRRGRRTWSPFRCENMWL
ncbi:hypothetical protein BC332_30740 [Capsicum chinense]|nr:hypothetical protein BC332_30740 [Capsicum chinense]